MTTDAKADSILSGYLSKSELAGQLNRSERTLDRWHELRVGPPRVVIGRTVLYRIEAVLEWLQECEQSEVRAYKSNRGFDALG